MLVFHGGVIVGGDVAGAIFDGSYTDNSATEALDFQVTMSAPAGVAPVLIGLLPGDFPELHFPDIHKAHYPTRL